MIKVGIVGISGYSGCTALELLLKHPQVRLMYVSANNTIGPVGEIWPHLTNRTKLVCETYDFKKASKLCDVIFLAVPHKVAMTIAPELVKAGKIVIDLSGDYRLDSTSKYNKWYGTPHVDSKGLAKAIYGLPELYREDIKKMKKGGIIANPGCYPTAAILGLAPVVSLFSKGIASIIIDAKSGMTGAGRKATLQFSFSELNENFKAYKVKNHQHTPEIDLYLSKISKDPIAVNFVPHLLPMDRGIFETIYVQLNDDISINEFQKAYERFYKTEKFVRILPHGQQPELKSVNRTNYCDIALELKEASNILVITSAIDNLMKGAAGQAVQNMNIIYDIKETEGLL